MKMEEIKKLVFECTKCDLHKTKTKYVFGEGDETTHLMFIGEVPGANEDKEGRPFVGKAGKIFNELLGSIDLNRGDIYITNILKCRSPNNRNPQVNEIEACAKYLNAQINVMKPTIICPMGNFATDFILKKYGVKTEEKRISKLHGKIFKVTNLFGSTEIVPLYHPVVATYAPEMKDILIQDMQIVQRLL